MSVDILAIGNNNRKKQEQDMNTNIIQPAWIQKEKYYSENMMDQPEAKVTVNPLDRQVEIGVGSKIGAPMSRKEKQIYANGLNDYDRSLMKLYKAEGYSFEASKKLVENKDRLLNPQARGIDKYDNYQTREMLSKLHSGQLNVGTDTTMGKIIDKEMKIWNAMSPENNIIKQWMDKYQERADNQMGAYQQLSEADESNRKDWLSKVLISSGYGISEGIENLTSGMLGRSQNFANNITARLENLILGTDIDPNFYNQRTNKEYELQAQSGLTDMFFWTAGMPIMLTFTALGNTKRGGDLLSAGDEGLTKLITMAIKNTPRMPYSPGLMVQYSELDEKGQEDMVNGVKNAIYLGAFNQAGKWKANSKIGIAESQLKSAVKNAFNEGLKGVKEQTKAEVRNVKEATDLYNEGGNKIGSMGPEGKVGVGESINRIVKRGVDDFKQSFIDRYNARHGGTVAEPGTVEPEEPVVGKPNNESKGDGVIQKGKDIIQEKWTDITTGLTPEERIRIQNDPYVADKFNKALGMINEAGMPLEDAFITEQLYNEVGEKILQVFDEWENKLQNTLPEYRALRELNTTYNLIEATPLLTDLLLKNDITQDPVSGELDFSNSKFVSDADMRSVQRAIDMIYKDIATLVTPRQYLNLRDKLDQLAKYTTVDASRGQGLIRQIRRTLDGVAKKQIPGLKELDDTTSKYFKEIAELKDGWVYKGGDRKGEIRNNFYSIIKNLTGQNRHVMLQRLEKYYPGVTEEIEAIHLTNKLIKAYNKSPQIVKSLGIGGAIGGGIMSGGNIVTTLLGAILGELINKGLVEPRSKIWRRNAINKLLSEMSPEAQAKLEEIARRQTYAKEISAEDQRILDGVAEIIIQERNRGLSEEAIRERERRTRPLDQEALPGVQPDIVDENGNITLGRGNVISPDKGPGRARRLTRINEINLKNPEATPDKQVLDLQEKLDIDTDTAREIQSTIDDFLKDVGANEGGAVGGREVNYEKFTTRSLEKLMDNDNLPRTEKDKIKDILAKRGAEEEAMSEVKADWDFATRIRQLSEEEQRIGKVGKNKVSKEVADKQMREWEKKKETLIKEMQDYYGIDQFEASDKYLDMESKGDQYIREYKRSNVYKTETAEREVLDSLMEGWSKQPKFVRDMDDNQLKIRQDFLNNIELQNGYKLETTDYNDRYILEDNGSIVDRGAIKYLDDGRIEITAQDMEGLKNSGLLNYLPDKTIIGVSGEDMKITLGELRELNPAIADYLYGERGKYKAENVIEETGIIEPYHYQKLNRELTPEEIDKGLQIWEEASATFKPSEASHSKVDTRDEARKIFTIQTLQQGYIEALGLDPIQVREEMKSRALNGNKLSDRAESIRPLAEDELDQWVGADLIAQRVDKAVNKSALESIVKKVEGTHTASKDLQNIIRTVLAIDSNQDYTLMECIFMDIADKRLVLDRGQAGGVYFPDTDELFLSRGFPLTVPHEVFHYLDYLRGREVTGEYGAISNRSANLKNATTEAKEFYRRVNDFIFGLRLKMPDYMLKDTSGMNNGIAGSYRSERTEIFARFGSAFVDRVQKGVATGPTEEIRGEHGDVFTEEDMADFVNLLQLHSKLKREGKLKNPHDVDLTKIGGKSHKDALADIVQKSLFEADDPLNGYKSFDYAKLNDDISALYDIAHPIARDSNYTRDAFLNQLGLTYSPDLDAWRFRLNGEGIKIDNDKLVRVYNGIRKIANEPRSEFVLKKQTNNIVMNALNKITEKMKTDPLDIPMEYGEMNNALKQQDWSPLERYLEKHPENINALWKTYDPDVVEWRDNLEKKFTGGGYISLTELYEIKNMIDDYIKAHPEDTKIEGTIDDIGIKFLVDRARYREKNNGKIGSYDKEQIEKVGSETNEILLRRIGDFKQRIKRFARSDDADYKDKMDEMWHDFEPELIYELGKTYDPNIDKWQKNISKKIVELRDKYKELFVASDNKVIKNMIKPHQLNGLKAKINELEKYSYDDIFKAFEGQEAELFFRAVKPRIEELKAKGVEKAVTNLVALHNLEEGSLRKLIENFNGKDPMPSIAVMDVNVPHEVFGDISLVFGRDTVDPKVDERNKIYGSDAWTPTFPRIKETGGMSYDSVRKFASDTVDNMIDNGVELTPEEAGYLSQDIGNIILDFDGRSDLQKNADYLAEQVIEDLSAGGYQDFIENNEGAVTELQWKIENFLQSINNDRRQMIPAEYFPKGTLSQLSKNQITQMVDELTHLMMLDPDMQGYGRNELRNDLKEIINENHTKGADAILDGIKEYFDVDMNEISSKINEIYQGGVPKDRPLTPENVLEAMRNQRVNRENVPGSYRDMIEIEGAKLDDIEDVRRQNFAKVFHGDRTGDLGDLEKKYDRLLYTVAKDIMGYDDTEIIQSQNMLRQEIKRSYDKDVETFKKNLVQEHEIWDAVPNELLQRIIDIVEQGKKIPIRFSESKPERIVNLMEEVQYILVPEGADASQVKSIVRGTPLEDKVVEYKPDNNSAPRSRKLKELQKKYGNVFFSMGGVVMPIAMLYLMMNGEDEGQA